MPTPGIGNRDQAEEDAQHHAEAERDIAELGRRLDRVAEVLADFFLPLGRRQHADPVAEFQHQVGRRHEVGIIAPNMQEVGRKARRHRQAGKRNADHAGLADEDPDVVEIGAVAGQPSRFQLSELGRGVCDRLLALGDDQHGIAGGQHGIAGRERYCVRPCGPS